MTISRMRPARAVLSLLAALTLLLIAASASAATYRTWIAQVPAAPTATDAVRIWMDSDTALGETAGIEYKIGSSYTKVLGSYDTSYSGANWRADIPAQPNGTFVEYQLFTRNEHGTDYGFTGLNWSYTVGGGGGGSITPTDARAIWLEADTIAWNGSAGTSYRLLYDPDGGMTTAAEATVCTFPAPAAPCHVALTASGTVSGYVKNPNATGRVRLVTGLSAENAKHLLTGQTVVAAYNSGGTRLDATATQIQSVLDALYAAGARTQTLGVTYSGDIPTIKVWAPTAQSVTLKRYATATGAETDSHPLTRDNATGIWSVTGTSAWNRHFYLFDVAVYVPSEDAVVNNLVTDPWAVSLSTDSLRSQIVNLADADLKPAGWDSLAKPALANFEDSVIYEVHIRDFSINDATVTEADRGTYKAFTYPASAGMTHLKALQQVGLTHIHLLPTFDIATINEAAVPRTVWPNPTGFGRSSTEQQALVGANRADDGFNWGYDPFHFGVPEGSYSTNPQGTPRILEFREMVSALNQNGLRVVMDVVYNHTAASGQGPKSVLDRVVPGYYHRYTDDGTLHMSSCCDDTATEYEMMEKLMIDTLVRFAVDYRVDGFRFDLMNLHTRQNMLNVQSAINAIDPEIYLYGEGWTFGSAQSKGLTTCPHCFADKYNMTGAGIGLFNDIIRDAAHGGYNTDSLQIRKQGFINGLSYDWNGFEYNDRDQAALHAATDRLRSALRGSGDDWNGQGGAFTADPQEAINYIEKHDNETLYDQNVFKLPVGVSMAQRVRSHNMGTSLIGLSQGIPFIHMGQDLLRSKSLDRNSYDSGDWFNRVWWDGSRNNYAQGLPPAWDNDSRWGIMGPLLDNTALDPAATDIAFAAAHLRETLRIRQSSPLFRLTTRDATRAHTTHYPTNGTHDGLIVMKLVDGAGLDPTWETILVFFNANKIAHTYTVSEAAGTDLTLHPLHTNGVDDDPAITGGATFNEATGAFTIPARTTAVFVSTELLLPASTIEWVGKMWPRGSVAHQIAEGAFAPAGFDVYVRVYQPGVTPDPGAPAGISCFLHWGRYGEVWSDLPMSWNTQSGQDDEFRATIPQATINGLPPGSYGFTAYCQKPGEGRQWKVDEYNIGGVAGDNDQGNGLFTIVPSADPSPAPAGGAFVHLFEWSWNDIAQECAWLGQKGYSAVQVAPPQEHIPGASWWVRYQPVSYLLTNTNGGTLAQFQAMVTACNAAGVDVYVDAVINHMAFGAGTGSAGSAWNSTTMSYPGVPYSAVNFHAPCDIVSYANRYQVQYCQLLGLPDLDYDNTDTLAQIQAYLNGLIGMGVKGFRIDAAKHIFAWDLERLYAGLDDLADGSRPYIFQEVIGAANEPVKEFEYSPMGDVTEFAATNGLGWHFSGNSGCTGALSGLTGYGGSGWLASRFAQVFVNNHDNQRGHGTGSDCIVTYKDDAVHDLATVFLLAHPYGYPSVMSSFYFGDGPGDDNQGRPATPVWSGGAPTGCNATDWVCEHRTNGIANMVRFRQVTDGQPLTNWQVIAADHIAFGRNSHGFVAINRTGSAATPAYTTGMVEGVYCDIIRHEWWGAAGRCLIPGTGTDAPVAELITVNPNGTITTKTLGAQEAFAIHTHARFIPTAVGLAGASADAPSIILPALLSTLLLLSALLVKALFRLHVRSETREGGITETRKEV